jgi:uncharacterized lipoprotein YehR (DUF1307 family)
MKKLFLLLLAAVMVFSLAACGTANTGSNNEPSAPPEGWAKEFTVYIGGSDEWTPYAGKSGVTFANSDKKVLEISDNGAKVEFTGLIAGDSVITATLDETESKALVHVRAVEVGEDLLKWRMPKTLYVKYEGFFYDYTNDTYFADVGENYYTGGEYEMIFPDTKSGEIRTWIRYESESLYRYYSYSIDSEEYKWDDEYNSSGWGDRSGAYDGDNVVGGRETASYWDEDTNPGGRIFYPLNAFAYSLLSSTGQIYQTITQYRQSGQNETILGVNCEVFVVDGVTYYVDPNTHYTLKLVDTEGNVAEVLEYDANYSGGVPYAPGEEPKLP